MGIRIRIHDSDSPFYLRESENRISNWVDHTQFIILSESIIQDGGDVELHRFIQANQKYDSESSKSYSVQVSKRIKYIP